MYGNPQQKVLVFIYMHAKSSSFSHIKEFKDMSHLHDLHFSESILCHCLWDIFFPLLIQHSSFDRRQNPLGLYHPHPYFLPFPKKDSLVSPSKFCFCVSVVGRWAALKSRHVKTVLLALLKAVLTLV